MGRLWAVSGGKGGVGKTFLTACMGIALARTGKSVVLADANIPAPDLHAFLGSRAPDPKPRQALTDDVPLSQALIATPEAHLQLLNLTGDELGAPNLSDEECRRISARVRDLDADHIVFDAGTGSSACVLDFFNVADHPLVVTSPDPASMRCTYRFIRNAVFRRIRDRFGNDALVESTLQTMNFRPGTTGVHTVTDLLQALEASEPEIAGAIAEALKAWKPILVVNFATSDQDRRIGAILQSAVKKFLGLDLRFGSLVPFDPTMRRIVPRSCDFGSETAPAAVRRITDLVRQLADKETSPGDNKNPAETAAPGLNHNVVLMGRSVHVQTEDQGQDAHSILTQVFCEGRVMLSRKSDYAAELRHPGANGQLLDLMRAQHFKVIRQLEDRNRKTNFSQAENA